MKEYEYTLTWNSTSLVLGYNPAGFDKLGITLLRHEVYHSVLRSFTLSLRFLNVEHPVYGSGGYSFIKSAYDSQGIFAVVAIVIKKRNPNTNDYDTLYTGVLDFTSDKFTFDRDLFCEIGIIDSSKLQKFISRDEIDFDVLGIKTMDDETIATLQTNGISLPPVDIVVKYKGKCNVLGDFSIDHDVPWPLVYSGSSSAASLPAISVNQIERVNIGGTYGYWEPDLFKKIYTNDQTDTKRIQLNVQIYNLANSQNKQSVYIPSSYDGVFTEKLYIKHFNGLDDLVLSRNIVVYTGNYIIGNHTYYPEFDITGYLDFLNVAEGDYFQIFYTIECSTDVVQILISPYETCNIEIIETTFGKPTTTAYCIFPLPAFNQSMFILTGENNQIESTLMNIGGELEYDAILNGLKIRNYPAPKLNLNFRDLFKSFDAIRNIGLGYDKATDKFNILPKESFFDSTTMLFDLGEVSKFKIQPYAKAYYNKIVGGFDNEGSYERVQGALEFAVKREYSTKASVKEEKNIECPYRFDSVMIEELRNMPYVDSATEDNDADNDVFIIRTNGTTPILPAIGNPLYLGMDVFYSYYNTMLTPRQNAVRWGSVLRASHYKNTNPIKAQKTSKQYELAVNGIDENSDISLSELATALFIPEIYSFESYLTAANLAIVLANPHGYIKFRYNGVRHEGFINKMELTDYNTKVSFELIAKNNSVDNRTFEDGILHQFEDGTQKTSE